MKNFFIIIIIILITLIIGEGFTRIFFSEFSKNQIFKRVSDYERVSGGKNQFFSKFQDLIYRISKSGVVYRFLKS